MSVDLTDSSVGIIAPLNESYQNETSGTVAGLSIPAPALNKGLPGSDTAPATHLEQFPKRVGIQKRLILCCDGTWQDAASSKLKGDWEWSNIWKIAETLHHEDRRSGPPVPQVVFYQSGVGTKENFADKFFGGVNAEGLADKVKEAYGFLALNYVPGDEIYIFGFSRGAYTARMVAALVGEIGILSRIDMVFFGRIFEACQALAPANEKNLNDEERKEQARIVNRYKDPMGPSKLKVSNQKFSIKCLGVFDTVGALGIPVEMRVWGKRQSLFNFSDTILGPHIEKTFHAMALFERRADFHVTKFHAPDAEKNGQLLKQCWFVGDHCDIGGGYYEHDLSDLSLMWMIANVKNDLSFDLKKVMNLPQPSKPWGEQDPHNSVTGWFTLGRQSDRKISSPENKHKTNEKIHFSVKHRQMNHQMIPDNASEALRLYPNIIEEPLEFELEVQRVWSKLPPPQLPSGTWKAQLKEELLAKEEESNQRVAMTLMKASNLTNQTLRRVKSVTHLW